MRIAERHVDHFIYQHAWEPVAVERHSTQLANNQTYTAQVLVSAVTTTNSIANGTLNVTLQVGANSGTGLAASPSQVTFNAQVGGIAPAQQVNITQNGAPAAVLSVAATTTTNQGWLLPSAGTSSVLVSINSSNLTAGTYTGTVTVNTSGGSLSFPVTLTVGGIPTLTISPTQLNFAFQLGTTAPLAQTIALTSSGSPVTATVSSSTSTGGTQWLIVTPQGQLTTPNQVSVSVQPAGLAAGQTYMGNISITSSGATNGTVNIPVSFLVSNNPIIQASPSSLTLNAQAGGTAPSAESYALEQQHGPFLHGELECQHSRRRHVAAGPESIRRDHRHDSGLHQHQRASRWNIHRIGYDHRGQRRQQYADGAGYIEHHTRTGASVPGNVVVVRLPNRPSEASPTGKRFRFRARAALSALRRRRNYPTARHG